MADKARADAIKRRFTPYTPIAAEGRRIGLLTCRTCGATVMLDEQIDFPGIHHDWHTTTEAKHRGNA